MRRLEKAGLASSGGLIFCGIMLAASQSIAGLTWPTNQFLPTFSAPAPVIDCIDISSASAANVDLFASLQGIVNRTQPRIACVSSSLEEGEFTWLTVHNLSSNLISGYSAILKYETNVTGLVVTDTTQPDTLNLATTIAGLNNELICDPSLLPTLTNSPYNLAVKDDLRGRFTTKYQVYQYLYNTYWSQCTHRIFAGMETNGHGQLREYLVAIKSAAVWLDPGVAADATALAPFISSMTPVGGVYMGWWPSEANGLSWIAQYGIPVIASDWYDNGSLFGGATTPISIPAIPPAPTLQNKVYVSITLSDGDNVQYMQHHLKANWGNPSRGSVPIGWTVQPFTADLDPGMLNYYWSTATTNDCLVAGPSGAGYTRINYWSSANVAGYTKASSPYLQRSGIRGITVWVNISSATGYAYATNCPSLVGLNDFGGGSYTTSYAGLPVVGFPGSANYASTAAQLLSGITNTAASWSGTAPMFIAVQGSGWNISPADCVAIANSLDKNKYVVVRPDHLFLLYRQSAGLGIAAAMPYVATQPVSQSGNVGTNITFSVIASGTGPLSYQWRFNSTNILGATNNMLAKVNIQPGDAGNYSVLVTNIAGSAVSSNASLTVHVTVTNAPYAATIAATALFSNAATLNGLAVANIPNAVAWFDWGTNTSYGQHTGPGSFGGYAVSPISAVINGLAAETIYHYRLVSSNALGVAIGADRLFSTGGRVKVWGDDSQGQTNMPSGLTNMTTLAAGAYHTLALRNDGTLISWGYNYWGQTNVPANLTNVIGLAAGFYHSLALKSDGTVVGWGGNNFEQLNLPSGLNNVVALAAGAYHSLALKSDGTVVSWGYNNNGQTNVPAGLVNVVGIAAGLYFSAALRADGTVMAWGDNLYGQTNVPSGLTNVVALSCGEYHCLAQKADGTVVLWGRNLEGQTNTPPNLTNTQSAVCGGYFNLVLNGDGSLAAWGANSSGQLNFPPGLTNVAQLAAGMNFGLAIGNQAPQAQAQTVSGFVNHDLPITLSGSSPDGSPLAYRVTTLPLSGALYQFAGGARGDLIGASNTWVSDALGRVMFAPGTNEMGNPYANFDFAANDGENDSAVAAVTVDVGLPQAPQMGSVSWTNGSNGGQFGLNFTGSTDATYTVWASTNLIDWALLGSAPEAAPGQYQYFDFDATNWPYRFYRLSAP